MKERTCRLCGNPCWSKTCKDCYSKNKNGKVTRWRRRKKKVERENEKREIIN